MPLQMVLVVTMIVAVARADDPDTMVVSGTITAIELAQPEDRGRVVGYVEIERAKGSLILIVSVKSVVEMKMDSNRRPCTFGELRTGDRVQAVCGRIVLASSPGQVGVQRLVIVPAPKQR